MFLKITIDKSKVDSELEERIGSLDQISYCEVTSITQDPYFITFNLKECNVVVEEFVGLPVSASIEITKIKQVYSRLLCEWNTDNPEEFSGISIPVTVEEIDRFPTLRSLIDPLTDTTD